MGRRSLALAAAAIVCFGCAPRGVAVDALVRAEAVFAGGEATVTLPEPWSQHTVGGAGRFLIFHLGQAEQAAVVDLAEATIVKTIPNVPAGTLLAAGADKLLLVRPDARMVERWSLATFEREQVAALPTRDAPRLAAMGCAGRGPLLLGTPGEATLVDVETLRPVAVDGKVIGATGRYGFRVDASADGRTFAGIVTGIGPVAYTLMVVESGRTRTGQFGGTSHAVRWARPSADGSVLFLPGGGLYAANLEAVSAKWLEGATCFPTPDPAFFLAVRFVQDEARGKHLTEARVCTTSDRRVVHTVTGLEEMAPRGNTSQRYSIARRLSDHERRFHYVPAVRALVSLPYDNRRVVLRGLDLLAALKAGGKPYLFVTSAPPNFATAGEELRYQLKAVSSGGRVTCRLESGPPGAKVSRRGLVRWRVPADFGSDLATLILSLRGRAGQELFHTVHVRILRRHEEGQP